MMQDAATSAVLDRIESWAGHAEAIVREAAPEVWSISMERVYAENVAGLIGAVCASIAFAVIAHASVGAFRRECRKGLYVQADGIVVGSALVAVGSCVGLILSCAGMASSVVALLSARYEALRLISDLIK